MDAERLTGSEMKALIDRMPVLVVIDDSAEFPDADKRLCVRCLWQQLILVARVA